MSTAQAKAAPMVERCKPPEKNPPKDYGWTLYLIVITLAMLAGFATSGDHLYKSGDKIGYNLGLVGGLMMLALLLYPLRKRFSFMNKFGILPKWFKWHMVFGILGPALIMFHSTFAIRSINAGVALVCMMLVSGSGIFGRFFYTKVHHGLYGRKTSYEQLKKEFETVGDTQAVFRFVPAVAAGIQEFRERVASQGQSKRGTAWNFLTVGFRTSALSRRLVRELKEAMYADARAKNWNKAQMKRLDEMFLQNRQYIELSLRNVRDTAQFPVYDRLFSWWHIFHVPLVFMLAFSSIWHVVAVHRF